MKKFKVKSVLCYLIVFSILMTIISGNDLVFNSIRVYATSSVGVTYSTHVQGYGNLQWVKNGAISGKTGEAKRLESIKIKLENMDCAGNVEYRTHVQGIGWQGWKSNGSLSGTTGQSKRLEAIQIKLTDTMASRYDIYYRVHAQFFGWLGWAKNGASAGTAGLGYRLEAIQIKIVKKGSNPPGTTSGAYHNPSIKYTTHVQNYGWQNFVSDGNISGTLGKAKRLEAIKIQFANKDYSGSIQYRTHVQNIGWMNWVSDGNMSGTSGQGKRLEAISIKLSGTMANYYDVYYRVYTQHFGWMGWAKNGGNAGTSNYGYRLEAIQIKLVGKSGNVPGSTLNAYSIKPKEVVVNNTKSTTTTTTTTNNQNTTIGLTHTYVVNTNSMKFHTSTCSAARKISAQNKWTINCTYNYLTGLGYSPCGICHAMY